MTDKAEDFKALSTKVYKYLIDYQQTLMSYASQSYMSAVWDSSIDDMLWDGSLKDTEEAVTCRDIATYTGFWHTWSSEKGIPVAVPLQDWINRRAQERLG